MGKSTEKEWLQFALTEQSSYDTIVTKKVYVDITSDLTAGMLLSQIVYWNLPAKDGNSKLRVKKEGKLWLAKSHVEWFEEIRITNRQAMRAVGILKKLNLVETKLFKFNGAPVVHYRLNKENLLELHKKALFGNSDITQSVKSILLKVSNGNDTKGKKEMTQSVKSITENTHKINIYHTERETDNVEIDNKSQIAKKSQLVSLSQKKSDFISNNQEIQNPELFGWVSAQFEKVTGYAVKFTAKFKKLWTIVLETIKPEIIKKAVLAFTANKWRLAESSRMTASILFRDENQILDFAKAYDSNKISVSKYEGDSSHKSIADYLNKAKSILPAIEKYIVDLQPHYFTDGKLYLLGKKGIPKKQIENEFLKLGQRVILLTESY